jgi:hypothetical protein
VVEGSDGAVDGKLSTAELLPGVGEGRVCVGSGSMNFVFAFQAQSAGEDTGAAGAEGFRTCADSHYSPRGFGVPLERRCPRLRRVGGAAVKFVPGCPFGEEAEKVPTFVCEQRSVRDRTPPVRRARVKAEVGDALGAEEGPGLLSGHQASRSARVAESASRGEGFKDFTYGDHRGVRAELRGRWGHVGAPRAGWQRGANLARRAPLRAVWHSTCDSCVVLLFWVPYSGVSLSLGYFMNANLLRSIAGDYDLQFVGGPPRYGVHDDEGSYVGSVTINSATVAFSGFSSEGDGVARWTKKSGPRGAATAVVALADALATGYGFAEAVSEFGDGFLSAGSASGTRARKNPRSTGYVAAKIRASTARRNGGLSFSSMSGAPSEDMAATDTKGTGYLVWDGGRVGRGWMLDIRRPTAGQRRAAERHAKHEGSQGDLVQLGEFASPAAAKRAATTVSRADTARRNNSDYAAL